MALNIINGTDAAERMDGTQQRDLIHAAGGNDTAIGWFGNDKIYGELGDDFVAGQAGNDTLFGGAGNDWLQSDDYDQGYSDRMYGGAGNDKIFADDKIDYSYGGAGDDQVTIYFDVGGVAYGGAGVDTLVMNYIGASLNAAGVNYDVSVTLRGPDAGATSGPDSMVLAGFEALTITTYMGNDTVTGGALNDRIDVYSGANIVQAGAGDDYVSFHSGVQNMLDGGAGQDTIHIIAWEDLDGLTLTVTGTDTVDDAGSVLTGFEIWQVNGSNFDDHVIFGDGSDWMRGRGGADVVQGMRGHDRLAGGAGDDDLYGGIGGDVLRGGLGSDSLTGGAGADTFQFGQLKAVGDGITDFVSGVDHIEIGARVIARVLSPGVVADSMFHMGDAIGDTGQFVYRAEAGAGLLIWDANGTGDGGELLIARLDGAPPLVAADLTILPFP